MASNAEEMQAVLTDFMVTKIVNVVNKYMLTKSSAIITAIIDHFQDRIYNVSDEEIYEFIINLEEIKDGSD